MKYEQEPICHVHDWCRAAIEGVIEDLDPEENHLQISTLREVQRALVIAKEKGQHMEDRLSEYREDIMAAGFGIRIPRAEDDDPHIVETWMR